MIDNPHARAELLQLIERVGATEVLRIYHVYIARRQADKTARRNKRKGNVELRAEIEALKTQLTEPLPQADTSNGEWHS